MFFNPFHVWLFPRSLPNPLSEGSSFTDNGSIPCNTIIRKFLFEPDLSDVMKSELDYSIREDIAMYFPKLVVDELVIESIGDEHLLQIFLKFHIRDTESSGDLTVQFA